MYDKLVLGLALVLMSGSVWAQESANITSGDCSKTENDHCSWSYDEKTKTLTISGTGNMKNYTCGGCTADSPSDSPWDIYRDNVENIVIENGITGIGRAAFLSTAATHIDIPDSVSSLGQWALAHMEELKSMKLPNNPDFKVISDYMMEHAGITEIDIPQSVETIGDWAFASCKSLEYLVIPDNISFIDHGAFNDVPQSVTIYCRQGEGKHNGKSCEELINDYTYFKGKRKIYHIDKDGYIVVNNRRYQTFDDVQQGKHIKRLIYTVEEAMEATKNGDKFHVFLTYK